MCRGFQPNSLAGGCVKHQGPYRRCREQTLQRWHSVASAAAAAHRAERCSNACGEHNPPTAHCASMSLQSAHRPPGFCPPAPPLALTGLQGLHQAPHRAHERAPDRRPRQARQGGRGGGEGEQLERRGPPTCVSPSRLVTAAQTRLGVASCYGCWARRRRRLVGRGAEAGRV